SAHGSLSTASASRWLDAAAGVGASRGRPAATRPVANRVFLMCVPSPLRPPVCLFGGRGRVFATPMAAVRSGLWGSMAFRVIREHPGLRIGETDDPDCPGDAQGGGGPVVLPALDGGFGARPLDRALQLPSRRRGAGHRRAPHRAAPAGGAATAGAR